MARRTSATLTDREAQLMAVLWERGPSTADAIRDALPDRPHDSTVRTLLRVLESKGCVRHEVSGRAYVYHAAVRRGTIERRALRQVVGRFFGGSAEALVLRLIEDRQLTPEQIRELSRQIDRSTASPSDGGRP